MTTKKFKWRDAATKEWHTTAIAPANAEPDTICLYTGTEDVNGASIFEGDILSDNKGREGKLWEVALKDGAFYATSTRYANSDGKIILPKKSIVSAANVKAMGFKVSGNIFD